ncbi:TORTIFOLIA1-like protein 2 [Amborella trichopoda]|uniref:TORTIFOLIA1-like protein 2 n=1 Tax=Amborella trichopoda TaxID=13333 RepID=UPI0009BEDA18|nr:TORTIFOLIA1-like protein 2 [Amborella trichopoda]|eukprot:XP_006850987.3 TORTIFOLIA1-like protein 2 [Amborella trichopoda]
MIQTRGSKLFSVETRIMKSYPKPKAQGKINPHQAAFELKQRVVLSLNRLADRDTYQIGMDELEKTAESLTSEGFGPFLSCIVETDSEQKCTVRKECVRILATLAKFHGGHLGPYLGKMIASIVKRLKDPDSNVRDACIETVGILASTMIHPLGSCDSENVGPLVVFLKPLFEALGEQNRQVQSGAALCLARVIDAAIDPPSMILQRILMRIVKLLKNPHFLAKPAILELIGSIIQAGGASTLQSLSSAMTAIQEALKSSEWTTRKAGSEALARIALGCGLKVTSFKSSCINSLESCRFDKVKPVRDVVMQALQYWRSLPSPCSPTASEVGSSTKENLCEGNSTDFGSVSDSGWKDRNDILLRRAGGPIANGSGTRLVKKRTPLADRKTDQNLHDKSLHEKTNEWHVEIALPKAHSATMAESHNEESESSCITKAITRTVTSSDTIQDIPNNGVADNKPECSSISDLATSDFETKHVMNSLTQVPVGNMDKPVVMSDRLAAKENYPEESQFMQRRRERDSLDSNISELCSQGLNHCCLHGENGLTLVQRHLLEIETKQSHLLDLLQVFMGTSMEQLSLLQSKVLGLERTVDEIAQDLALSKGRSKAHYGNCSNPASYKLWKKSQSLTSSPRVSTYSPRPSADKKIPQSPMLPTHFREQWEEPPSVNSKLRPPVKQGIDHWRDPKTKTIRNSTAKGVQETQIYGNQISGKFDDHGPRKSRQVNKALEQFTSLSENNAKHVVSECRKSSVSTNASLHVMWEHVKEFLHSGDFESAFVEALCCGDDHLLLKLMDRTGPIMERLSQGTAIEILRVLAANLLDCKFLEIIIPWSEQVVDLSAGRELDYLVLSSKDKREFLSALREAAAMHFPELAHRRCIAKLSLKLGQVWGKCS